MNVCLKRVTPSSMSLVRQLTDTGTILNVNAYASQVASSLQTHNGTRACATGFARHHLVIIPNTSTSTNVNASASFKSALLIIFSTMSPATVSAFKTKVAQVMNIGTTGSASANAHPRRVLILNTGMLVCARVVARTKNARQMSISTTSVVAASASLLTVTHLELVHTNCLNRSGLITLTANASASIQHNRLTQITNYGSSI